MDIVSSPKVGHSLPKPWCLLWEALVCEKHIPKPAPNGTKKLPQHGSAMTWHHAKFHDFQACFGSTRILKQSFSMFSAEPRCPDVWISFPFLAWDLEIHPRTHMWFFNQHWCTGTCACSSNLDYAHKMSRNSINVSKRPNEPGIIPKFNRALI